MTENANYNWHAHKDYTISYLGNSIESLNNVRENTEFIADQYDEETFIKYFTEKYVNQ